MIQRKDIIEDLFELEKIYYISYMKITIHEKTEPKQSRLSRFFSFRPSLKKIHQNWNQKVMTKILNKKSKKKVKNQISILITEKGIPKQFRSSIWKYLIGNKVKISKSLF